MLIVPLVVIGLGEAVNPSCAVIEVTVPPPPLPVSSSAGVHCEPFHLYTCPAEGFVVEIVLPLKPVTVIGPG